MANSMVHWNGCQMAAVSIVTSGPNPDSDDLLEIAIVPMDSKLEKRTDIMPLNIWLKPLEAVTDKSVKGSTRTIADYAIYGLSHGAAIEVFEKWFDKLGMYVTKYGNEKQIIPIGYDYKSKTEPFLRKFFGFNTYDEFFDFQAVDILTVVHYLNDRRGMRFQNYEFVRIRETEILRKISGFQFSNREPLQKCLATAMAYKELVMKPINHPFE